MSEKIKLQSSAAKAYDGFDAIELEQFMEEFDYTVEDIKRAFCNEDEFETFESDIEEFLLDIEDAKNSTTSI